MGTNEKAGGGGDDGAPIPPVPARHGGAEIASVPVHPIAESAEWLRVTLSCIGDGVITTDRLGRVTFLNTVAQALTGWTQEQATEGGGVSIERVFHIVNEATRVTVENPTVRALRDGVIIGLANHTLLIARDSTEIPIDDSAAPIRNAGGETAGAVLVFRDVTEHKRKEKLAKDALDYASNILATQREPFLVLDKDLRVVSANYSFYKTFRVEKDATEGRLVYQLGDGQWDIPKLRELLEEVLPRDQAFAGFEVAHDFPAGVGPKIMLLNVRKVLRPGNNSELILLAIEDITERRRAEMILAAHSAVLELSAGGGTLADVFDLVVRSAQRHAGVQSRASLFTLGADGARLRFAATAGMSEAYSRAVSGMEIGPGSPSCGTAAFAGKTVIVADVKNDPSWAPLLGLAEEHDIRACWSHPMLTSDGKVLGTLAIYHRVPCEPGPGDLDAMNLLGQTTALVIERHREQEKRRHAELALRESETRFRRLFETAKDGIIILDAHTRKITDANAFMCELTGMEASALLGKELHEIGMYKDIEENKEAFRELLRTGYLRHDHLPVQNQHGERVEVEFIANVYQEGERLVAQCNVRDISERTRMEKELARHSEALAAQSRGKDEFLAMLSHELRNPLAPIRAAVHLLRLQEGVGTNNVQQQAREIIERQVAMLTSMVSDLLEVSRVSSGRIQLDRRPLDVKQAVVHAMQTAAPLFEQHKHAVSVNLCSETVWANADPTRLEEVLVNLLNNSAKYTPDGGRIEVSLERERDGGPAGGQSHALVRVSDNGVGIDSDLLPHIFELFTQADRSLARSSGGLGIGLSLARRLVDLHGGTVRAESQGPGKGSVFTVRLPLIAAPLAHPASAAPMPSAKPRSPDVVTAGGEVVRVLVVDDNVDLVAMLAGALRHRGFAVATAHNGPDGLRVAQEWLPNIVLLDIGLPGLDGYEVARRLRADPVFQAAAVDGAVGGARMKLIAITGYGQEADIAQAREAGFDGHMVKPCDFDELEKMMLGPSP